MNKKKLSVVGVICGALLTLGPVWGLLLSSLKMSRAFEILGKAGVADPQHLALTIGDSLMAMMIGLILCPFGLVVLGVSIIFLIKKAVPSPPCISHQPHAEL